VIDGHLILRSIGYEQGCDEMAYIENFCPCVSKFDSLRFLYPPTYQWMQRAWKEMDMGFTNNIVISSPFKLYPF